MERYFYSPDQHKAYKLKETSSGAELYWVQVYQLEDGSFTHARGMDKLESFEKGLEVCGLMALPYTEERYLDALKDYFAIDKQVREYFIKKYNL